MHYYMMQGDFIFLNIDCCSVTDRRDGCTSNLVRPSQVSRKL